MWAASVRGLHPGPKQKGKSKQHSSLCFLTVNMMSPAAPSSFCLEDLATMMGWGAKTLTLRYLLPGDYTIATKKLLHYTTNVSLASKVHKVS